MTSASKVGDLFAAAGEAFNKLAELSRILQTASATEDNGQSGWSASDTESLQMAVKRFGDELNVISEHIKDKTMSQIKTTFRKIQPSLSNTGALNERSSVETSSGTTTTVTASAYGGHDSATAYQLASGTSASSSSSMLATAASASETSTSSQHANASTAAAGVVGSSAFAQSSSATGAAAASSCSSPSPFLHYPLLRKSADITLNMLNARDDSDDDGRVAMSVFNSV